MATHRIPPLVIHSSLPALHQALKADVARQNGAVMGLRHIRSAEFLNRLLSYDGKRQATLTSMGRHALLRELLKTASIPGSGFLRLLLSFKGTVSIIADFLEQIEEAGITVRELQEAASRMPENREKWETLAELYCHYRKKLEKLKIWDSSTKKERAEALILSTIPLPFIDERDEIHYHSFYRIEGLDFRIMVSLAERAGRRGEGQNIFVHIPYDPYRQDAFRYLESTVMRFEMLADSPQNLTLDLSGLVIPPELPQTLSFLRSNIFRNAEELISIEPADNDGSLHIIKAPSAEGEVDMICREIRRLLEQGVHPAQITIAFRSLSRYGPLLSEASKRYSLPFTFPLGNAILSSHLVRTLLSPFHIVRNYYSVREVLKFIFSRYIDCSTLTSGTPLQRHDLEMLIGESGVIDDDSVSWDLAIGRLQARSDNQRESPDTFSALIPLLSELIENLKSLCAPFHRESAPAHHYVRALQDIIRHFRVEETILTLPQPLEGTAWPLILLERDLSAFQIFKDMLADLEKSLSHAGIKGAITCEDFYDTLVEGLKTKNMAPPGVQEGVRIMEAPDLAGWSTPFLFLGGLTEGVFPIHHYEETLFKDHEKQALSRLIGRSLFQSTAIRHWEDNLLFFLALASAETKLFLCCSTTDDRGNAALPSFFLEQVTRLVRTEQDAPQTEIFYGRELLNHITAALWRPSGAEGEQALHVLRECLSVSHFDWRHLRSIFNRCAAERAREHFISQDKASGGSQYMGFITMRESISGRLPSRGTHPLWSASMLEDYGSCPFAFYAKRLIGVRRNMMPEEEMDPMAEGTLLHEILEKFYGRMAAEGRLPVMGRDDEAQTLLETAQQAFECWEESRPTGDPAFWRIRRKAITRTLARWLSFEQQQGSAYVPCFFEQAFGDSQPFELRDSEGNAHSFKGFIDRIDIGRNAFRIIDYKNSSSSRYREKLKADHMGTACVQIPLYALAAEHIIRERKVLEGGPLSRESGYALLKKPALIMTDFNFKGEDFSEYFAPPAGISPEKRNFTAEICGTIEKILSGHFQPEGLNCTYCDYSDICRFYMEGEE